MALSHLRDWWRRRARACRAAGLAHLDVLQLRRSPAPVSVPGVRAAGGEDLLDGALRLPRLFAARLREAGRVVAEILAGDIDEHVNSLLTAAVGLLRLACNEIAAQTGEQSLDVTRRLERELERMETQANV